MKQLICALLLCISFAAYGNTENYNPYKNEVVTVVVAQNCSDFASQTVQNLNQNVMHGNMSKTAQNMAYNIFYAVCILVGGPTNITAGELELEEPSTGQ